MHSHDDRLEIILIRHGNGFHNIDGNRYMTCRGDLIIYNSGAVHDECASIESGMSLFFCALKDVHFADLEKNKLIKENCLPVIKSGSCFNDLEFLFSILHEQSKNGDPDLVEYSDHILKAFLIHVHKLVQEQSIRIQDKEKLLGDRIRDYLDTYYAEEINLQSIAENMGISIFHLSRVFKTATGYSPRQYIIRRRIGKAQSELLYTSRSVSEIAYRVGFNNANHFNNTFNKIIGMNPGKYRKYWAEV